MFILTFQEVIFFMSKIFAFTVLHQFIVIHLISNLFVSMTTYEGKYKYLNAKMALEYLTPYFFLRRTKEPLVRLFVLIVCLVEKNDTILAEHKICTSTGPRMKYL